MITTSNELQKLQNYIQDQHNELKTEVRQILVGNSEANINKILDKIYVVHSSIICKLVDSVIRVIKD